MLSVQKGEDEKALQYVDFLNNTPGSPWKDKVKMANEGSNDGSINQKSFVKAIKKYVLVADNPILNTQAEDRQHRIFLNYWTAIVNIIGDDESIILFKYNGVELFCKFSVSFFHKMMNEADFKVQTMQNLLQHVFDNVEGNATGVGRTDFWIKGHTASGLNASALSKINTEMVKALHKPIHSTREREMEI